MTPLLNRIVSTVLQLQEAPRLSESRASRHPIPEIEAVADRLIAVAGETPYFHLPGYMERYWFMPELFGHSVRLHHILRSDDDRALHDHPWDFSTILLRGQYIEHRDDGYSHYGPGTQLWRAAGARHSLELPEGQTVWTLFMMGPRVQKWGFFPDGPTGAKVPWEKYLSEDTATYQRESMAAHGIQE